MCSCLCLCFVHSFFLLCYSSSYYFLAQPVDPPSYLGHSLFCCFVDALVAYFSSTLLICLRYRFSCYCCSIFLVCLWDLPFYSSLRWLPLLLAWFGQYSDFLYSSQIVWISVLFACSCSFIMLGMGIQRYAQDQWNAVVF